MVNLIDAAKAKIQGVVNKLDRDKGQTGFQFTAPNTASRQVADVTGGFVRKFGEGSTQLGTALGKTIMSPYDLYLQNINAQSDINLQNATQDRARAELRRGNIEASRKLSQTAAGLGERAAQRFEQSGKDIVDTMKDVVAGTTRTGLTLLGGTSGKAVVLPSMAIGAATNAILGDKNKTLATRIGEGAGESIKYAGINRLTGPIINPVAERVGLPGKVALGSLSNLMEDITYTALTEQRRLTKEEALMSIAVPAVFETGTSFYKAVKGKPIIKATLDAAGYVTDGKGRYHDPIRKTLASTPEEIAQAIASQDKIKAAGKGYVYKGPIELIEIAPNKWINKTQIDTFKSDVKVPEMKVVEGKPVAQGGDLLAEARKYKSAEEFVKPSKNTQVFYNDKVVDMGYAGDTKNQFRYGSMRISDNLGTGNTPTDFGFVRTPEGKFYEITSGGKTAKVVNEEYVKNKLGITSPYNQATKGVAQGGFGDIKQPWQMTAKEWDNAFSKTQVNFSGTGGEQAGMGRSTKNFNSKQAEQEFLKMGLKDRVIEGMQFPARHKQVIEEAVRQGLPVPENVLKEYPDIMKSAGKIAANSSTANQIASQPIPQEIQDYYSQSMGGVLRNKEIKSLSPSKGGVGDIKTQDNFIAGLEKDQLTKQLRAQQPEKARIRQNPVVEQKNLEDALKTQTVESRIQGEPPKKVPKISSTDIIPPDETTKIVKSTDKVGKVNLLDWVRTPDRVLRKIGLGAEAEALKTSYNKYLDELPKEINKITDWYNQVKDIPNSSQNIFKYLDGQEVDITLKEKAVADEIKGYLSDWADRLGLPKDSRIASYITHIFEKDFIQKDFDEDLAKIIADKVPGSVYDPFLQQRLGKQGYVEDAWRALDAYVKRATRKVNMDPALEKLNKASDKLDLDSWKYVKEYADRINLRPTQIDNYLDNLVKESPVGYRLGGRPTTAVSRKVRQAVYRGTLGLNFGSAVRNLTQGVNTYSKLGEKYTAKGYMDILRNWGSTELDDVGVLRDTMVQDRQMSAVKGIMEKLDSSLWAFFNAAEKINRGASYYGAKAKYLSEGMSEDKAIQKAVDLVRDTQFTFGSVDTPVALQSDIVKTLTQFQSFNVKQAEFLTEMIKNKEFGGMLRWVGANMLIAATLGKVINMDFGQTIPFYGELTGEGSKIGQTPPFQLAGGVYKAIVGAPDKYGNVPEGNVLDRIYTSDDIRKSLLAFIPAGVQAKKTITGIGDVTRGYAETARGNVKYPVEQNITNLVRGGLFGPYSLGEAQQYYDEKRTPLSEQQSALFKQDRGTYQKIMDSRVADKLETAARDAIKGGGQAQTVNQKYLYWDSDTEQVKSVKLDWKEPELPKLTGNSSFDKKLISSYKSEITKRQNDIMTLFEQGQMTQEQAIDEYLKLDDLKKTATNKVSKPKKITIKKVSGKLPTRKYAKMRIKSVSGRSKPLKKVRFRSSL